MDDSGNVITKSAAKKEDSLSQGAIHSCDISGRKNRDKDSTSNLKDTDTNKGTKMDVQEQPENLPDLKKEETKTDDKHIKTYKKDPVKVAQNKKHTETVTERAKDGNTTSTTNEEENEGTSKESHKQHERYYEGDHPKSRPETERKSNSDLTQQESVLEDRTETSVERKRKDGDKKDTTIGIRSEHVMVCACVLFCAMLTYFVSNANQEIKELKERLDKMQESYDSLSLENIQNRIKREVKIFKKDYDELKDSLKSENGNLRKDLTYEIGQNRDMMEAELNRLKTEHESQGQIMKELTSASRELKSKMEELSGKVLDLGTDIGQIQTHVTAHGQAVDTLDKMHKALAENVEKHGLVMGAMQSQLDSYQTEIQSRSVEILERITKADADLHEFEKQMSKTSERLQQHDKELDTAFDNLFNKKVAIIVITLMLCVIIGLVIAVYILCQNQTKSRSLVHGRSSHNNFSPVLDEIPVRPRLQKALGVISFSREYQRIHKRLVQSVERNLKTALDIEYHIIRDNRDIPYIPLCQLVVIFVEHNDRYVILEEEGDALGDCNRTTLMAVKRIGAVPVIIYDQDLGSRQPSRDQLYSKKIWGVRQQTELIELSSNDRFFSVYEKFSEAQELAFRKLIENHVLKS